MFKLLVPLLAKNSLHENVKIKTACCVKNYLISSPSATNVIENLTLRRHFLFSTTNSKTIKAFPTIPKHQLGVSNRYLGQQIELLPLAQRITKQQFQREFHSSSVLFVDSSNYKEAVDETTLAEKTLTKVRTSKKDSFRKQSSLFEEDYLDEENQFNTM